MRGSSEAACSRISSVRPVLYGYEFVRTTAQVIQNAKSATQKLGKDGFFVVEWHCDRQAETLVHPLACPLK
jgi:hypothetical protein